MNLAELRDIEAALQRSLDAVHNAIQNEMVRKLRAGEAMMLTGGHLVYLADEEMVKVNAAAELARFGGER